MTIHTVDAAKAVAKEVRTVAYVFPLVFNALYLCYVAWSIITAHGVLWINIVLAALCVVNIVCCVIPVQKNQAKRKTARRIVLRSGKALKLIVCTITLIGTVYSIYMATTAVAPFTLITATLSILAWIIQLVLFVGSWAIERWVEMIAAAVEADYARIKPFVTAPGKVINGVATAGYKVKSGVTLAAYKAKGFLSRFTDKSVEE